MSDTQTSRDRSGARAGDPGPRPGRVGLGGMIRAGGRALRDYTGLTVVLYLVQLAVAAAAGLVTTQILASAFAAQPLFDDAVDGDVSALVFVLSDSPEAFRGVWWLILGAAAGYAVLSWFLTGGLIAVLIGRPSGRRAVAEQFGAGGAVTFFSYLRLALWGTIPNVAVIVALGLGLKAVGDSLQYGVTAGELWAALVPALLPGVVLYLVAQTAIDYARIGLVRDPDVAAWRALVGAYKRIFTCPWPLVHVGCYWAGFAGVSALYVAVTLDRPMFGVVGALSMFVIRQGLLMVRFAAKLALVAGQVELTAPRARPRADSRTTAGA